MSLHRYATRRDATERSIFSALRLAGADVLKLDVFDALVLYRGKLIMLDCKASDGRVTEKQQQLIDRGFPLKFATTPEEALKAIGAVRA